MSPEFRLARIADLPVPKKNTGWVAALSNKSDKQYTPCRLCHRLWQTAPSNRYSHFRRIQDSQLHQFRLNLPVIARLSPSDTCLRMITRA